MIGNGSKYYIYQSDLVGLTVYTFFNLKSPHPALKLSLPIRLLHKTGGCFKVLNALVKCKGVSKVSKTDKHSQLEKS